MDHRTRLLHLLAPGPNRHALSAGQPVRRLFAFDRSLERRYVAGADEAGRGCLAGPLVAAAVLFDLEELTLSDRRSLARLNDSKQHTEAGREELYPLVLRAASKASIVVRCVRGIDSRGLHKTNLEALRTALKCVAREEAICLVDGFRLPRCEVPPRTMPSTTCRRCRRVRRRTISPPRWS